MEWIDWQVANAVLVVVTKALVVILFILAAALWPRLEQWLKGRLGEQRYQQILGMVRSGVLLAEQWGIIAELKKAGMAKKAYAIAAIQRLLDERVIKVDAKMISDLVDLTVYEEFNRYPDRTWWGTTLTGTGVAPGSD